MPVSREQKGGKPNQVEPNRAPQVPVQASKEAATPSPNGKRKKKKTKAKLNDANAHARDDTDDGGIDFEEDRRVDLKPMQDPPRAVSRTGLSPGLESVHLSTTASLSASAASAARLNPYSGVQNELMNTAKELYENMDAPGGGLAEDEEYWRSFPPHIRNFAQAMYTIAQQMVQSGAVVKNGTAKGVSGTHPSSLPFDPSLFSDPAFNLSVEQAAASFGPPPPPGHLPRTSALSPADVVLLDSFAGEEPEYAEDDCYSEDDEGDVRDFEEEFEIRSAAPTQAEIMMEFSEANIRLREDISTDTDLNAGSGKKRNKKNQSNGGRPASARNTALTEPKGGIVPADSPTVRTRPASVTTNPQMPAPTPAQAPPSSRVSGKGKEPMSYSSSPASQPQPQSRTARAASKAPLPPHAYPHNHTHHHPSPPSSNASAPHKPRPPALSSAPPLTKGNKIWSTSSLEERERIKEFWLGLGEEERRNLVKIEKDTVLRKMKEQQRHSCNCAVCGRKRNAIEEELEVLYDAYYEELEQYANYQQRYVSSGGTIPPPPGPGPFPGSVELDKNGAVVGHPKPAQPPTRPKHPVTANGRKHTKQAESEFDDDEGDEDEYEDDEEYEEDEEEEEEEEDEDIADGEDEEDVKAPRGRRPPVAPAQRSRVNGAKPNGREGLFNLGTSLTVTGPGNILTVADDLLKNDGQKFLEMMEQLAERRMQREEEAAADVEDDSEEDEDDEGDEDDEDDEEEDDEEDDDDEEAMTEEQKMEEGKRMFSIFAARMFEQRVLQAYRERVAQERQLQLLRELEDEDKMTKEKEAKKQTQNQKKKDKKKQQKQVKEEEKAQKAAEKAAEEAALKAKQTKQEEEQRKKREEERVRREALRKTQEEEKLRKEEERRKRLAEEKEREAEREKKRKEKEERLKVERREREEKERKAREEKEARLAAEKAAAKREQLEKEERERKLAREREEKAEKEARERLALQHQQQRAAAQKARAPASPRNPVASGSSPQRSPITNGTGPKKILNKVPPPASAPPAPIQPPRPQQQRPVVVTASQPPTPITTQLPHIPPTTPIYAQGPGMLGAPAMSPRVPFAPPFGFGPGPSMQQGPPPPLAPSALPRNFGSGPPYDPGFGRGLAPTTPIGPPPKTPLPISPSGVIAPGPSRRSSILDPGPVARPIAPIARPNTSEAPGSGSVSPSVRSPSPKGVLGSSALAADDDEVVPPPGRRIVPGAVGQGWGPASPRPAMGDSIRAPWGPPGPVPPPGFVSPRPPSIGNSVWGNTPPNPEWHPAANFFPSPFITNNDLSSHPSS